jgi:LysR family glycine cleavage system transcriptional activator
MNKPRNSDLVSRLGAAAHYLVGLRDTGSFTKTAKEFGIHQTALSHRLRGLEDMIGQKLFERTTRSIELTPAGEVICAAADATLIEWSRALEQIVRRQKSNKINLSLPSSLALKWIVPALPRAYSADIDLSLEVDDKIVPLSGSGADVAIRFGPGPYPGNFVMHLSHCEVLPVARPGIVKAGGIVSSDWASDVRHLKDKRGATDGTGYNWTEYYSSLGGSDQSVDNALEFERADLMLQAGIGGMGVALGRTLLVENDIQENFLEVVGPPTRIKSNYWLVTSPDFSKTDVFSRLLNWLKEEIERSQSIFETHTSH